MKREGNGKRQLGRRESDEWMTREDRPGEGEGEEKGEEEGGGRARRSWGGTKRGMVR